MHVCRRWSMCVDRRGFCEASAQMCAVCWRERETLTPTRGKKHRGVVDVLCYLAEACKETITTDTERETNSAHLFTCTLPPPTSAFASFRPRGGSSERTATLAEAFPANFAETSRPGWAGEGEVLRSSSFFCTTSFSSGSTAALPPKKYKSRKTPKHTAITTTLQWIRMVRATCCGPRRQTGARSCLRERGSSPGWHFLPVHRSHFPADDDGEELLTVHGGLHRGGVASAASP